MSEESQGGVKRFPLTKEQIKEINQTGREVFFDYFHDYENKNESKYTTRYAIRGGPSYSRLLEGLGKIDEHEFELCNGKYTLQLGISASFKNVDMKVFSGIPPESLNHDAIAIKIIEFSRSKIQQTLESIIRKEERKSFGKIENLNPPPGSSLQNYLEAA